MDCQQARRSRFFIDHLGPNYAFQVLVSPIPRRSRGNLFDETRIGQKFACADGAVLANASRDYFYLIANRIDKTWRLAPGEYTLYIGGSERNVPLSAKVEIAERQGR